VTERDGDSWYIQFRDAICWLLLSSTFLYILYICWFEVSEIAIRDMRGVVKVAVRFADVPRVMKLDECSIYLNFILHVLIM